METVQEVHSNQTGKKYLPVSHAVLRQEGNEWGILFDADNGEGFAVDPVAVFIWKQLDGKKTVGDIIHLIKQNFIGAPDDVTIACNCNEFINQLVEQKLVTVEI